MKNWSIIVAAVLISGSIAFFAASNRYYIDTSTKMKVDRLTGETIPVISKSAASPTPFIFSSTPKPVQRKSTLESYIEYLENIKLLKDTPEAFSEFKEYYNSITEPLKKDPLIENSEAGIFDYMKTYSKYCPAFYPDYIITLVKKEKISDANEYLEYLIEYYEKSIKRFQEN